MTSRRTRPIRQRSSGLLAVVAGVAFVAVSLGGAPVANAAPDDEITVPDAALLACINSELGQGPTDPVTEAQAATITGLVCANRGVGDLTGIEHLTELESAILDRNDIADISPLETLTSLQTLGLSGNQIEDVGALAGLTMLEFLRISSNDIQDVSALVNLTALEVLDVSFNPIVEIGALAGMTSLQSLFLEDNDVEDLSPLGGLTAIEELALSGNEITDVSALTGLTSLKWLYLDHNRIEDVDPLASLTSLQQLDLDHNRITDVSALADLGPVVAILDITDQLVDLGDLEVEVLRHNPVVGLDGLPVSLDDLYDAATNSFTPVAGGPTALRWVSDDGRFSGTLTFDPVEGDDTGDDENDTDDNETDAEDTEDDAGEGGGPEQEVDDDAEIATDDDGDGGRGSTDSGSDGGHAGSEPTTRGTSMLPATGASPLTTSLAALGAMLLLTGASIIAWTRRRVRPTGT